MTGRPLVRRAGMVSAAVALLALVAVPCSAQVPKAGGAPPAAQAPKGSGAPPAAQAPKGSGAPPAAAAPAAAPPPAAAPADVAGVVHVCSSCHGPRGHSVSSTFPRLAGQQKDYLVVQLQAFREKTRADPHAKTYMWGMAARLSDPLILGIADYYSSQPPVPGTPDNSPEAAAGRKIYTEGIAAESVPACMACHGEHAEGNSAIPRLASQHRGYIERQLKAFASMARANEIMHDNSKGLTDEQIRDVADYVKTQ